MNIKLHYTAPDADVVIIGMESGFLTLSQAPNVEVIDDDDIYDGSW